MARAGILSPSRGPRREYRFTFQDLVLLRSARRLIDSQVPQRRVHRALRLLVRQLPAGRPPSEVRLTTDGQQILAHDGDSVWCPENGQLLMGFGVPVATSSSEIAPLLPVGLAESAAEDWYQHALGLEPVDTEGAIGAYRQALSLDEGHVGAHVQLGRLLQASGDLAEAIRHYRTALEGDSQQATAAFNLGTALDASGQVEEAIAAYRHALGIDPRLADAHYNLSLLYQRTGHTLAALVHLKRYREMIGVR
jgi:tetratricopeptide (TPR) repeat protein